MSSILTVIQARVSSTRLPNKVLLPLGDSTVLEQMINRLKRSRFKGKLLIATSTQPEDSQIEVLAKKIEVPCFRGHLTDLLDRHYQAMLKYDADIIIKIPSDCPLIDPQILDDVISFFLENDFDYLSNLHPQSYPDGNDVEIIRSSALAKTWKEAKADFEREHTTPFLWNPNNGFNVGNYLWNTGLDLSRSVRYVLDYKEDYDLIREVFDALSPKKPHFELEDIVSYLKNHPEIYRLNEKFLGDSWYKKRAQDLKDSGYLTS